MTEAREGATESFLRSGEWAVRSELWEWLFYLCDARLLKTCCQSRCRGRWAGVCLQ